MRRQLVTAAAMVAVLTVLCGLAYPLVVLGVAQVAFPHQANGSIREVDGRAVGSDLLGQSFTGDRSTSSPVPPAAGDGYDAMASSAHRTSVRPTPSSSRSRCPSVWPPTGRPTAWPPTRPSPSTP